MKLLSYRNLFFIILAFYCLVLSQFGLENWDTGYIPSFSWRIINGQDVYQDFIYKGPPVTLYFHAFFMKILPQEGQFFFIRVISYSLFSLQVYFTVSGFDAIYNLKKTGIDKWALIIICFIVSIHNFGPFPWPTTDGLLFASVAFWLMSKNTGNTYLRLFFIAFFSLLSALTKQSFYLIPLLFIVWVFINYNLKKAAFFGLCLVLLFLIFIYWITSITTLENFLEQITNQTKFSDLIQTGFIYYIKCFRNKWILITVLIFPLVKNFISTRQAKLPEIGYYLKWLTFSFFIASLLFHYFDDQRYASVIFFNCCIIALLYNYFEKRETLIFFAPIIVSLVIAWSTSISLGYHFTILFSTGMIMSFIVLYYKDLREILNSKYYFFGIAISVCLVSFTSNRKPYRDSSITQLKYRLDSISPKLKYIKTDKDTYEHHLELKQLIQKYGTNFIVAPNTPMANYIFNTQSKLPADWIISTEVLNKEDQFIKLASDKKNYIFVERTYIDGENLMGEVFTYSKVTLFIVNNFNQIDQTKHFVIYNSLKNK
ncbi:hypothetical protein [Flavobacterium pectinovorum]|uniref:Glycosyltransferase RgtA/B/C/D-like domain-containing protein n=1 Tax=Flavobacterium pectinovorum TaxID=29533 RepID=A0A502EUS9_9FLAO|nr:hypothetical protein [Flavobacterium pectinovorum]TPG41655.1 hypothetical protein EAH81_09245 [Flavobacterium pectinovorum]